MFLRFQTAFIDLSFYDVSVPDINLVLTANKNLSSVAYRNNNSFLPTQKHPACIFNSHYFSLGLSK